MLTTLMISQGVPMLVAGDECRRTQRGNNNAYCQDNEISWFNWNLAKKNKDLLRFTQALIKFRRGQPTVRREQFLSGSPTVPGGLPDVSWYSAVGTAVDWSDSDLTLICLLTAPNLADDTDRLARDVLLLVNATTLGREFILPPVAKKTRWRLFVDTAGKPPFDVYPECDGPAPPTSGRLMLPHHSLCCYVADRPRPDLKWMS